MKPNFRLFFLTSLVFFTVAFQAQVQRPKLVVGIVVDQMRWDYLYRFQDNYTQKGFNRLLKEGFSCENTQINYLPSYTAVGHTTLYTGTVPAFHGIAGNDWVDQLTGKKVYCTDDDRVQTVGTLGKTGQMSPCNLWVSTITDELRMATNNQAKIIGISLKDRAAILPAGHKPNGAYWLDDDSGNFITSTYYQSQLPQWVNDFNSKKWVQKMMSQTWNPILDPSKYTHSDSDMQDYEGVMKGLEKATFPYDLSKAYQARKSNFRETPFGNTLSLEFAKASVEGVAMGQDDITDFLAINLASTDYLGHLVGPNAMEIEDMYIRLDQDLGDFFTYLDQKIGKNQYLVFLSADHGGAHAKGFSEKNNIPTGFIGMGLLSDLNLFLKEKYKFDKIVKEGINYQLHFDYQLIEKNDLNLEDIKKDCIQFLEKKDGIQFVVDQKKVNQSSVPDVLKQKIMNGYNHKRSGEIIIIPNTAWLPEYSKKGTTHGVWAPYDSHIPMVFMGWGIPKGKTNRLVQMTDLAPTLSQLLHIQEPNGNIGNPIVEILDKK